MEINFETTSRIPDIVFYILYTLLLVWIAYNIVSIIGAGFVIIVFACYIPLSATIEAWTGSILG